MRFQQFSDSIDSLYDYFQRKRPESGTKKLWFKHVQDIPGEALTWITTRIERTCDGLPRNIGKAFRDAFDVWRNENPDKFINYQKVKCDNCGKDGFIFFRKYEADLKHTYGFVARCGGCENWIDQVSKNSVMPIYTKDNLVQMGVELVE